MSHIHPIRPLAVLLFLACSASAQTGSDTTTPVKHVVVIFQENVSFDHYFATYPNAAGNSATDTVTIFYTGR